MRSRLVHDVRRQIANGDYSHPEVERRMIDGLHADIHSLQAPAPHSNRPTSGAGHFSSEYPPRCETCGGAIMRGDGYTFGEAGEPIKHLDCAQADWISEQCGGEVETAADALEAEGVRMQCVVGSGFWIALVYCLAFVAAVGAAIAWVW